MKYEKGKQLMLLELLPEGHSGPAQPIASATILDYNEASKLYTIRYKEYGSEKEGELEVPENRLYSMIP